MQTAQVDKARSYAQQHPQQIRLSWVDRRLTTHTLADAVELCGNPLEAGNIIGAVAGDRRLEDLLNQLIDGD